MLKFIKTTYKKYRHNKYIRNRRKINVAKAERCSKKYVLTKENEEEARSFFEKNTGLKISLAFHNYYTEKTGRYFKEYIPEDIYYCYIDEYYNDKIESKAFSNKCYSDSIFSGIKMPETLIRRIYGFWYTNDRKIVDENYVYDMISHQDAIFVKKAQHSSGGKGVYFLSKESGNLLEQFKKVVSQIEVDIIVQKPLKQHPSLAKVNESSVNTIRVLTFQKSDGSVKVLSSILRMGVSGAKVDNASSGGITCGIDESGHCREVGFYSYVNEGKSLLAHPTSNIPFKEIKIPNYDKVLALVKTAQPRLPHFRLVSWDVAVGEDGEPVLIEANLLKGEIDFHQINNGPLFGDETENILREVFSN